MRTLTRLAMACLLLTGGTAHAQSHWKDVIGKEHVKVAGGKMVSEGYRLCKTGSKSFQVRSYAEAPDSAGISRDFFIQFSTMMEMIPVLALTNGAGSGKPDCKPISSPIGKVDLEVNVYMTGEGFQLEMVQTANDKTVRHASRWADMYSQD